MNRRRARDFEVFSMSFLDTICCAFGAIILLCWLTFRTWKAVLCIMVPLTIVSILCNALMAVLGIGLKVPTLPVIALGVGVGVDYGIYLFERMQHELKDNGATLREAFYEAMRQRGTAAVFTAITMSIGVGSWAFAALKFQADMGILLAFMFLVNVFGAIFLLPGMACWLDVGGTRKSQVNLTQAQDLVLLDLREPELQALAAKLQTKHGIKAGALRCDLTDLEQVRGALDHIAGVEIGLVVFNAALAANGPWVDSSFEDKMRVVAVNVHAVLLVTDVLSRPMIERQRGGIVLTSSMAALQGAPGQAIYAATKSFDLILAESLWGELSPKGVDVMAFIPGMVRTPNFERSGANKATSVLFSPVEPAAAVDAAEARGAAGVAGAAVIAARPSTTRWPAWARARAWSRARSGRRWPRPAT